MRTCYPGNLGAVARAMANFGVSDLRLVEPVADPMSAEARAMASHGEHLLDSISRHSSLQEAVADCVWVACTSARTGGLFRDQNVVSMREGALLAARYAECGKIALVFGPEDHGLTNDEISKCHYLLTIPADSTYGVLNLSQAVVIALYELHQVTGARITTQTNAQLPTMDELNRMFNHLEEALRAVHFVWGEKGPSVFHALRHVISRAEPNLLETKLLHGLARQLLWYVNRHPCTEETNMPPDEQEA